MRPGRAAAEARALMDAARAAARAHGGGALRAARTARRLRTRQGFTYGEALRAGLLDPAMPEGDRAGHVSRHATLAAQRRLNPEALGPLTGDKGIFYRHCADVGLPVPRLVAIVDRAGGWRPGDLPLRGPADLAEALAGAPDWLILKPAEGYQGREVHRLRRDGIEPERLHRRLLTHPEFGAWVLQERLRDHPVLRALGHGETLQTLRIVTLVERSGEVAVLTADMRVAVTDGPTDNFRSGRSGNGVAAVDVASGVLGALRLPRADRCGFVHASRAPGTGAPVEGLRLPHWDAAVALVRRGAPHFLPARTLGWDVALTSGGPMIVETNMFWWPRTHRRQSEVLARLSAAV